MDFESLRCFSAVAATLNFRAAASRVHLSAAAFSDRIRRLEDALGERLLERTTRRVTLTDHGRAVLPRVHQVLAEVDQIRTDIRGAKARPLPLELVVGTRYELGLSWLCPALGPLARAHPERTIHLYNGDTPDLRARLDRGELDALVGSMRLAGGGLTHAVLHDEDYAFVGSPDARLRRADDAASHTLVDVTRDLPLFRYLLDALPGGESWKFERTAFMGGIAAIRRHVLDGGRRVAVLPLYFIRGDLAAGRLRRLLPRTSLRSDSFRLIWRVGHPHEAALRQLADELRALPLR